MTARERDVRVPLAAPFKRNHDILTEHGGRDLKPGYEDRGDGCPTAITHE